MRERRWESQDSLPFSDVLALGERLAARGLAPAHPAKDLICYIEEWTVSAPDDLDRLDAWHTEDVTLVRIDEAWQGDFFLLLGAYHTVYDRHRSLATYCSISHPWRMPGAVVLHHPTGMAWLGFRHTHTFVRIRLHTTDVVTPGETREEHRRPTWLEERQRLFGEVVTLLDLPLEVGVEQAQVVVRPREARAALFCSWPDAFGPCQFEYNTSDPYEFLVPVSRLAATWQRPTAPVRAYLTGFTEEALAEFATVHPSARSAYRCSVHCPLDELPEVQRATAPDGRLYATLCEFQTREVLGAGEDASAIVGVLSAEGRFKIEVRLNRAPLAESRMAPWLEDLLGMPVVYSALPPFP